MNCPRKHICWQSKRLYWVKGTRVESSRVREPRRTAVSTWLAVSGFMVIGLVSALSLAKHSDSESFLAVQSSLSQARCQWGGFWEVVGHMMSPFDHSRALLVGGDLLVPCSLPGPPVVKQFMQVVIWLDGVWRFLSLWTVSISVSSLHHCSSLNSYFG